MSTVKRPLSVVKNFYVNPNEDPSEANRLISGFAKPLFSRVQRHGRVIGAQALQRAWKENSWVCRMIGWWIADLKGLCRRRRMAGRGRQGAGGPYNWEGLLRQ